MSKRRYLVTGGAGYVGSHLVLALTDRGDQVTVLDNLCLGHREALPSGIRLVEADLADDGLVDAVVADGPWDAVLHFAALSQVGDSMQKPLAYFVANAGNSFRLLEACVRHRVQRFVLSSTANLYGTPPDRPLTENETLAPSSPYGESKLMIERALAWADRVHGLRSACLRYFNAAGADPAGRAGEDHAPETHLIPIVIDAALGRRGPMQVYGDDYATPDGTCVRDYVHVSDLADAHLRALDRLETGSVTYNVGSGRGHSVLEVIRTVEAVSGLRVPYSVAGRRAGDPPILVASAARLQSETGWRPKFQELGAIVETAYRWRRANPDGYTRPQPKAAA